MSWLARARAVRKITRHGAEVVADEGQRRPAVLDDHCLRHQRIVNAGADQLGVIPRAPPADRRRDVGGRSRPGKECPEPPGADSEPAVRAR